MQPTSRADARKGGEMTSPLVPWLAGHGGVAHTSVLRAAGFGTRPIATAVAEGAVVRVRRSWIAAPDCSAGRRAAASVGGRLTCVSAARERGLWTPRTDDHHVWVPSTASRLEHGGLKVHCATPPITLPRTDPDESMINVLFHVSRCLPRVDALAVWESALRIGAVDAAILSSVRWGSARARAYAKAAGRISDSGLETHFRELMASIGVVIRQQVWIDGHPVDGLIGDSLVVQVDGFAHHRSADRRRDLRQDARLILRGYTVLRFDYVQVLFEPEYVIETVRMAMAQRRHLAAG